MSVKDKVQCQLRLYEDQYKKVKLKIVEDRITFQKLGEVLFEAYLSNNKEVLRLVRRHSNAKYSKKRRHELTFIERDELLRKIEKEHSPLRKLEQEAVEELNNQNNKEE